MPRNTSNTTNNTTTTKNTKPALKISKNVKKDVPKSNSSTSVSKSSTKTKSSNNTTSSTSGSSKTKKNDVTTVSTKRVMDFVQSFLTNNNCDGKVVTEWNNNQSNINGLIKSILDNKTTGKRVKDPNAPKRPWTAFMHFSAAKRDEVRKKNPEMKITEVAGVLSVMWKKLSDKERQVYNKKAEQSKKEYTEAMKNYTPTPGYAKVKKAKDPNSAKKTTGYMLFCKKMRPELTKQNMNAKDIISKCGSMWRELSVDEKSVYNKEADTLKKSLAV